MIESQDDFVRIRTMNGNSQSSTSMGESSAVRQLVSVACHDNPNPLAQCTHLVSALDCCVESIPSDRKGRVLSALKILKRTIESPHASQIVRTNANFPSVPSPVKSVIVSFGIPRKGCLSWCRQMGPAGRYRRHPQHGIDQFCWNASAGVFTVCFAGAPRINAEFETHFYRLK
eukprot:459435_1